MPPIEDEVPRKVVEAMVEHTSKDLSALVTYSLAVKDLLTEGVARLLLQLHHPEYDINVQGGIRALQIGDAIYPIERLYKKAGNKETAQSFVILQDGRIHKFNQQGNSIRIAVWSEFDTEGQMAAFSDELYNQLIDTQLNLIVVKKDSSQIKQHLVGPTNLQAPLSWKDDVVLWDMHSKKMEESNLSYSAIAGLITTLHDLAVDMYTS